MAAHITVVTRRSDWRIKGRPGERKNLCGGDYTDRDILLRDARRMTGMQAEEWNVCGACIGIAQRMEAQRP